MYTAVMLSVSSFSIMALTGCSKRYTFPSLNLSDCNNIGGRGDGVCDFHGCYIGNSQAQMSKR